MSTHMSYNPRKSLGAQVPRSPAGTPRSSRRLTVAHTPGLTPSRASTSQLPPNYELPKLDPLSYPLTHYTQDPVLEEMVAFDYDRLSETVAVLQSQRSERRFKKETTLSLIKQQEKEGRDRHRHFASTVERHAKEDAESKAASALMAQEGRKKREELELVRAEKVELQVALQARRAEKSQQQLAFNRQLGKNTSEIRFFEETLGLKIRGKPGDIVRFKFLNIDPKAHAQQFAFDINASQHTYSVSDITPAGAVPQATVDSLLGELNATRDFYEFVARMRDAFRAGVVPKEERRK